MWTLDKKSSLFFIFLAVKCRLAVIYGERKSEGKVVDNAFFILLKHSYMCALW